MLLSIVSRRMRLAGSNRNRAHEMVNRNRNMVSWIMGGRIDVSFGECWFSSLSQLRYWCCGELCSGQGAEPKDNRGRRKLHDEKE